MPDVYEAWHPNGLGFWNLEFEIFKPILSQALSNQPISFGEDRDDG